MTNVTETGSPFDLISDFHKDAYGFRPNQAFMDNYRTCSYEERKRIHKELNDEIVRSEKQRLEAEERALAKLKSAMVQAIEHPTMQINGWKPALLHVLGNPTINHDQDLEHELWKWGIGWQKMREITRKYFQRVH